MFISARPKTNFSDTAALKERFKNAAARIEEEQKVKDKLDQMAAGFLSLDGTDFDQDENPGSVFVGNDKMIATAQARPFGGVLSMEVLDESGPETKEYNIQPDLAGVSYTMNEGGVETFVYENGNGLLALMEQIETLVPEPAEEPKGDEPKEEKPEES
jgi:hypothetical protein